MIFKKNHSKSVYLVYALIFFSLLLTTALNLSQYFIVEREYSEDPTSEMLNNPKLNYISESYPTNETVGIIVKSSLWANTNVKNAVMQYEKDLEHTGYSVIRYTANVSSIISLRNLLRSWYQNNDTVGAVLIGDLPYLWFRDPAIGYSEVFESDLYLMDLDGDWWDTDGDGIYDTHNATTGADVYPEIYVGRIDASTRTLGGTTTQEISNLINRFHSYRKGSLIRTHKALVYIDDDWHGNNWQSWVEEAYPIHDDVYTPTTWTNKTDWLTRLNSSNYEFAHLAVHTASAPAGHRFGTGYSGSEGNVTANEINNNGPGFTFYNLFCCRGADYNTSDCMATTYLFSGSYAQTVLGSTKFGGMLNGAFFYDSLAENNTFGQALIDWFQSNPYLNDINNQSWFYGLCILGDPFATIHYDCSVPKPTITSSTHNEDVWSTVSSLVRFNWTCDPDVNGLDGYYYILDQNPVTIPTASSGTFTKINGTSFSDVADGIWYLHVVAKDNLGNIGEIGDHFKLKIDTTGPEITLLNPTNNYNSSTISTYILWDAVDLYNNYQGSVIYDVTSTPGTLLYSGIYKNFTVNNLAAGLNKINISCSDIMGNWQTLQISIFVDLINPFLNITSPLTNNTVSNTFTLNWQAMDGESGIKYTEIFCDGTLIKTINGPLQSTVISGLSAGTHTINVTTYDYSGRSMSQSISIKILAAKNGIPGYFTETFLVGFCLISVVYIIYKKRKIQI